VLWNVPVAVAWRAVSEMSGLPGEWRGLKMSRTKHMKLVPSAVLARKSEWLRFVRRVWSVGWGLAGRSSGGKAGRRLCE